MNVSKSVQVERLPPAPYEGDIYQQYGMDFHAPLLSSSLFWPGFIDFRYIYYCIARKCCGGGIPYEISRLINGCNRHTPEGIHSCHNLMMMMVFLPGKSRYMHAHASRSSLEHTPQCIIICIFALHRGSDAHKGAHTCTEAYNGETEGSIYRTLLI